MELEKLMNKLPSAVNWCPLGISKVGRYWVIEYRMPYKRSEYEVESESLEEAVKEMLKLVEDKE